MTVCLQPALSSSQNVGRDTCAQCTSVRNCSNFSSASMLRIPLRRRRHLGLQNLGKEELLGSWRQKKSSPCQLDEGGSFGRQLGRHRWRQDKRIWKNLSITRAVNDMGQGDYRLSVEGSGEARSDEFQEAKQILLLDGDSLELAQNRETAETLKKVSQNGGMSGMAEAFDINPRVAFGITAVIAMAALVVPLFMQSALAGPTASMQNKVLTYVTMLCGFYMAWNIGANDVANAMGTSVGSGALTLRQAVMTAAFLEFAGAFLVGSHVSHTMQKGIIYAGVFAQRQTLLFCGMLSSLAAAGTWLQVASWYGWPVSTTHCIIGAMVGFGLIFGGLDAVHWSSLARVVSSWVVSPLMGAAVSFVVYKSIRAFVYSAPNPGQAACKAAPIAVFLGVTALMFCSLAGSSTLLLPALQSLGSGALGAAIMHTVIQRNLGDLLGSYCKLPSDSSSSSGGGTGLQQQEGLFGEGESRIELAPKRRPDGVIPGPMGLQLKIVYSVFGYLQVLSACFMSFAHGANDVANAIGPISAALAILSGKGLEANIGISVEVLAWGGFGIVAGLLIWGYRVIATIGNKITELTPTRGFAAEFAAATVVVIASRCGLPVSATHTLVGAVMGVGFARGLNSIRGETVKEIVLSWVVTIPIGAGLAVLYTWLLLNVVPAF